MDKKTETMQANNSKKIKGIKMEIDDDYFISRIKKSKEFKTLVARTAKLETKELMITLKEVRNILGAINSKLADKVETNREYKIFQENEIRIVNNFMNDHSKQGWKLESFNVCRDHKDDPFMTVVMSKELKE